MAWTKYQIFLIVLLVVTGSFNTLSTKWADKMESKGADGTVRSFTHPFFQTVIMFIGELSCLLAFKVLYFYFKRKDNSQDIRDVVRGNRNFSVWIFCLPAICDITATSIMYIGLTLTYASSFQMLRGKREDNQPQQWATTDWFRRNLDPNCVFRFKVKQFEKLCPVIKIQSGHKCKGSLIIFVALLSVGFLHRKINYREWTGIIFVIFGLILVGVSDFMSSQQVSVSGNSVITGDLLIVLAQVITAVQIVLEEHFVSGKDIPPLQAVGWEGCFGFTVLGLMLIPLYYIHVGKPISYSPEGRLEDLNDALVQIKNNLMLLFPLAGCAVSIAFFNFAGISVTKEISGTTRTVLDSVRTLFVWAMSLAFGWQSFSALQIFGFLILLLGIFIYNDILVPDMTKRFCNLLKFRNQSKREEPLLNRAPDEVNP